MCETTMVRALGVKNGDFIEQIVIAGRAKGVGKQKS